MQILLVQMVDPPQLVYFAHLPGRGSWPDSKSMATSENTANVKVLNHTKNLYCCFIVFLLCGVAMNA